LGVSSPLQLLFSGKQGRAGLSALAFFVALKDNKKELIQLPQIPHANSLSLKLVLPWQACPEPIEAPKSPHPTVTLIGAEGLLLYKITLIIKYFQPCRKTSQPN
jgi:hypothetical protein